MDWNDDCDFERLQLAENKLHAFKLELVKLFKKHNASSQGILIPQFAPDGLVASVPIKNRALEFIPMVTSQKLMAVEASKLSKLQFLIVNSAVSAKKLMIWWAF